MFEDFIEEIFHIINLLSGKDFLGWGDSENENEYAQSEDKSYTSDVKMIPQDKKLISEPFSNPIKLTKLNNENIEVVARAATHTQSNTNTYKSYSTQSRSSSETS